MCEQHLRQQRSQRTKLAEAWAAREATLINQLVDTFKIKCKQAAVARKPQTTVELELMTRHVHEFPKRGLKDGTYYVDHWGAGLSAEAWFYHYCSVDKEYP